MNILLLIVAGVLVILSIDGYRRGLIRKLVGIVGWVLTLWLVAVTVPYITEFLKENTALYSTLQRSLVNSDVELMQMLRIVGLDDMAGGFVADKLLQLVSFVVSFLLVGVVVQGVSWALHIASKLPLIHGANRWLGALAGFLEGLFLVWIVFMVIGACSTSGWGSSALYMIAENGLLTWLFVNNPLMHLITG